MNTTTRFPKTFRVILWLAAPLMLQAADPAPGAGTAPGTARGGVGGGATTSATAAAPAGKSTLSKQDEQFLQEAAQGSMMEVKLGEVASSKASDAKVKEFGAMMVKDHGQASKEVTDLAGKKGVALPTELAGKHQAKVDKLSKLTGADFDKAYVAEMVSDHKKDVADFEKASKSAADPDVKAWAAKTLPTLQAHLQHAQEMKKNK